MSLEEIINNWYDNVSDETLEAIDQLLQEEEENVWYIHRWQGHD